MYLEINRNFFNSKLMPKNTHKTKKNGTNFDLTTTSYTENHVYINHVTVSIKFKIQIS